MSTNMVSFVTKEDLHASAIGEIMSVLPTLGKEYENWEFSVSSYFVLGSPELSGNLSKAVLSKNDSEQTLKLILVENEYSVIALVMSPDEIHTYNIIIPQFGEIIIQKV